MANKGKYYESQFEEATIELLQEAQWQYMKRLLMSIILAIN